LVRQRSLGEDLEDVKALIEELGIACPESGSKLDRSKAV
jgi:hypothetical protein